jgi:hypothetical protein
MNSYVPFNLPLWQRFFDAYQAAGVDPSEIPIQDILEAGKRFTEQIYELPVHY